MAKCKCGSRPKKGAPPISTLRLQDLADPNYFIGGVFISAPPPPSLFSVVWGEDTTTFCARDPDRLYLEFAPYDTAAATAALRRLWTRNCECKPIKGIWQYSFSIKYGGCSNAFGCKNYSAVSTSNYQGAAVGVRVENYSTATRAGVRVYGFTPNSNYTLEQIIYTSEVRDDYGVYFSVAFAQGRISDGCYSSPGQEPPLPPGGLPYPHPTTPPLTIPPDFILYPEPPPKPVPKVSSPAECCDCC